jgi:hypothetical protein
MAQKIDFPGIYRDARQAVPDTMQGIAPMALPDAAPGTLADVLAEDWTAF